MLDFLAEQGDGYAIIVMFTLAILLSIPLARIARSEGQLTWAKAVALATLLTTIGLLLVGDVPSRIIYWFDATHESMSTKVPFGPLADMLEGENYFYIRDAVANTVQGIFAVVIFALVYVWGERHRKEGRFKS